PAEQPDRPAHRQRGRVPQAARRRASSDRDPLSMARESEFLALDDAALRAVTGPHSRHIALIEDAYKVLVEAPGGGVTINGSTRDRAQAKRVIETLAARSTTGAEITEADVRTALGAAATRPRDGQGTVAPNAIALPV